MGVYADAAGPVGRGLDTAFGTASAGAGSWRRSLLVVVGVLLVRGRRAPSPTRTA